MNSSVTITGNSVGMLQKSSIKKSGKLVGGSIEIKVTATHGIWTTIGTLSEKPNADIEVPFLRTGNIEYGGAIKINTDGNVSVYTLSDLNGQGISFTFSFACT